MNTLGSASPAPPARPETVALFISDLHLHSSSPATTALFLTFMEQHAVHARQLYILGDLFEYWAGDDDMGTPFFSTIVDALAAGSRAGIQIFWMPGNRDFLVGDAFVKATGATLLRDPHVATLAGVRVVLTHGDAQCTDDRDYQAFRHQVRSPQWQQAFLTQPLAHRKIIIDQLRSGSREAQMGKSMEIMDVNPNAIDALFKESGASLLIHGHTHRPAVHDHGAKQRFVLPDWDGDVSPPRGGWLALDIEAAMHRFDATGNLLLELPRTPFG